MASEAALLSQALSAATAAAPAAQPPSLSFLVASQALESSVGTDRGWFSLRRPLVVAVEDLPRAAPRAPRSVARPRPRAPSVRPPRVVRAFVTAGESAPVVVVKVLSLALDLAFLSFGLETSPHCEMVPGADG